MNCFPPCTASSLFPKPIPFFDVFHILVCIRSRVSTNVKPLTEPCGGDTMVVVVAMVVQMMFEWRGWFPASPPVQIRLGSGLAERLATGILEPCSLRVEPPGQANKICQPNPQQTPRNRCFEKGARGDLLNDAICACLTASSLSKLKVLKVSEGKLEGIMKGNCFKLSSLRKCYRVA